MPTLDVKGTGWKVQKVQRVIRDGFTEEIHYDQRHIGELSNSDIDSLLMVVKKEIKRRDDLYAEQGLSRN